MQAVIFLLQSLHTVQDLVSHISCGITGLFLYGKYHAGIAVDLCIYLCRIICDTDICHIRQADRCQTVQFQVQKDQVPQTVHILHFIPYPDQILLIVLCHIPCRHGKVLCREDSLHHIGCEDRIQIGFVLRLLFCLIQLVSSGVKLRLGCLQLSRSHGDLGGS